MSIRITKIYSIFNFIFILLFISISSQLNSQNISFKTPGKCGFEDVLISMKNKGFKNDVFESEIAKFIDLKKSEISPRFTGPIVIPIVFHVIYRTANIEGEANSPNLSQSIINAQIEELNENFRNLSGSTWLQAHDIKIEFCAATISPSGAVLSQPGINRVNGQTNGWANTNTQTRNALITLFDNTIKPATIWDPTKYVNIWTADMTTSGLLGYATFPSFSTLEGLDNGETSSGAGVVIAAGSVGSNTQLGYIGNYNSGKTLTHELGHFFGLRHIWGDSDCGNDFCNDTPNQFKDTNGCPAEGTLNECTPSTPKMFQNYMDYSFDACLNTFTENQASRAQAVMDNSPRRKELINSNTCSATNSIYFVNNALIKSELSTSTSCPASTTLEVQVKPIIAANGNAQVSLIANGTATQNVDFSISPSFVEFVNGETSAKSFIITIFDDNDLETNETIILNYQISGTGVTPSSSSDKSAKVTIIDNDNSITFGELVTLKEENFGTTGTSLPSGWTIGNLNGVSSSNTWVVNNLGSSGFSGNYCHVSNGTSFQYSMNQATQTYVQSPNLNAVGLKNIKLSFNYVSNGEKAGSEYFDFGELYYSTDGTNYTKILNPSNTSGHFQGVTSLTAFNTTLPENVNGASMLSFRFVWISDNSLGSNPPFGFDDFKVTGNGTQIESSAESLSVGTIEQNKETNFLNYQDTQIIASIRQTSENVGCSITSLSSIGNGQSHITSNSQVYAISSKRVKISPITPNTTASYQLTLYFTNEELEVWGTQASELKILKIKDGTDLSEPMNNSNAQIYTPVFSDQRASSNFASYTVNITNGFSEFMLASPSVTLPITKIILYGLKAENFANLKWITFEEEYIKFFQIESSVDGKNFHPILQISSKGKSTKNQYSLDKILLTDGANYFRIKVIDYNEEAIYSNIVLLNHVKGIKNCYPNPSTDVIFISGYDSPESLEIKINNIQGKEIFSGKVQANTLVTKGLNITNYSNGIYFIQVKNLSGNIDYYKVIKN